MDDYAGALVTTVQYYRSLDPRVEFFARLFSEDWGLPILNLVLKVLRLIDDLKTGPEYNTKAGDEAPVPAFISLVRAIHVLRALQAAPATPSVPFRNSAQPAQNEPPAFPKFGDEVISKEIFDICVEATDAEWSKAMEHAGYKMRGPNAFDVEQWAVDPTHAKKKLRKVDFLYVLCSSAERQLGQAGVSTSIAPKSLLSL